MMDCVGTNWHAHIARTHIHLHCAVAREGLDPELYVIPWMESLFADSVSMEDALRVWDILLALDARFVPFLCIASLMQVCTLTCLLVCL